MAHSGVSGDLSEDGTCTQIAFGAENSVEEKDELALRVKLDADQSTAAVAIQKPPALGGYFRGGPTVSFPCTIIPSRTFSHASHHVLRPGVSNAHDAVSDAPFS